MSQVWPMMTLICCLAGWNLLRRCSIVLACLWSACGFFRTDSGNRPYPEEWRRLSCAVGVLYFASMLVDASQQKCGHASQSLSGSTADGARSLASPVPDGAVAGFPRGEGCL